MKRELRKLANKPIESDGPKDIFADMQRNIEKLPDENGLSCFESSIFADYSAVVAATKRAVSEFAKNENLVVRVVTKSEQVPSIPTDYIFNSDTDLQCCPSRMQSGENVIIAAVFEERQMVGYAIANKLEDCTEIESLDVDLYSRRSTGCFGLRFSAERKMFEVGVGHVAINAIVEACQGALRANAVNAASQYIFESLGFVFINNATEGIELILDR